MSQEREGAISALYETTNRPFQDMADRMRLAVEARVPDGLRDAGVILIVALIALADLLSPPYLLLTGFYFFPIFLSIWFASKRAIALVLMVAMGMVVFQSLQLVPKGAGWGHYAIELVSFLLIFPVVAGLLLTVRSAVTAMRRDAQRMATAASVFESASEGIVITDLDGVIIEINEAFSRITGYSREELIGATPGILQSEQHDDAFYRRMWEAIRHDGQWQGEIRNRRKCGKVFSEWLKIRPVRNARGQVVNYIGLYSDISPIRERQRELERIAHFDTLTGLPNRTLLMDRLSQAMVAAGRNGSMVAAVSIDLDGFKEVNDNIGHTEGDRLLCELSQRMRAVLSEQDTLARVGGDEFVAVLTELSDGFSCQLALDRVLKAVTAPAVIGGHALSVTASIGVAIYPRDGNHADQLMRHAAQAMMAAKLAGRNCLQLFDAAQNEQVRERNATLARIRRGLEAGEFVLYYQPKVHMVSGRVVGAEALIRWLHPERGLLPPASFLPEVESDPLVSEQLANWVLDAALAQLDLWAAKGLDVGVSINIGARQLQTDHFVSRLRERLASRSSTSTATLTLEILETHALDDIDGAIAIIDSCHTLGLRFALDDFGTGYSSLAYLARLNIDEVKIDQGFVRNMLDDQADAAIVEGVLGLVSAFRREVIAEGVETEAHGLRLIALGCEFAQGYGVARPMPADDFARWVSEWKPFPSWTAAGRVAESAVERFACNPP